MTRRFAVGIVSLLLIGSACARSGQTPQATGGSYGSGVSLEGIEPGQVPTVAPSTPGAGGQTSSGGGSGGDAGGGSQQGGTGGVGRSGPTTIASDSGPLGANAPAYLRGTHRKLVIEVTAVEGKNPRADAFALLNQRLAELLDKPDGIEVLPTKTIPAENTEYTLEEVRQLETRYRKQKSDAQGPKAVIHVLYINGQIKDSANVLGVAYGASSVVMLPDRIAAASNPVLGPEKIERAVLIHEIGHILGLVNIGYRSPRDHEDFEHKGHSKNKGSVMFWAVDSLDIGSVLAGDVPTTFDADDKADLADRKAGKL